MTENDILYIKRLVDRKIIVGPVLELGAGYGGGTSKHIILAEGLQYYSTDITPSQGVDYVADFESDDILICFPDKVKFKTILVLNVLEHTFNPIRVLDNAIKLLDKGGSLVVITPCIWTLHKYPIDCYRLLPNFYERYAEKRGMTIDLTCFEFLGFGLIASNRDKSGNCQFPLPGRGLYYWYSRIVHRIYNTFGRGMYFPNQVAIGSVISIVDSNTR